MVDVLTRIVFLRRRQHRVAQEGGLHQNLRKRQRARHAIFCVLHIHDVDGEGFLHVARLAYISPLNSIQVSLYFTP